MKLDKDSRKLSKKLFAASFTDGRLDPQKVNAVAHKITESKPRNALGILKEYHRLARLEVAKHHAVIESAAPLDENTSRQLVTNLEAKYGAGLSTEFKVSPELLGGVRVKVGSDVVDGTVRERLRRLEAGLSLA